MPALDVPWLMPAPTSWWGDSGPEQAAVASDGVRLAVTAVLQALPPQDPRLSALFEKNVALDR